MEQRILLVEDEEHLQEGIRMNLELDGFSVTAVSDGQSGIRAFREKRFDLVVLDVMLPEMDGFTVCQTLRLTDAEIPVLFLTAKDSPADRVEGFRRGGDDYLTKPFHLEEFLLRVRALLKRRTRMPERTTAGDTYGFGGNLLNFSTYEAKGQEGKSLKLTKKECMLLKLLIERKNEVVSRETILETVWGYDVYPTTRTIDNFIVNFRKYFEPHPRNPVFFHSVRGVGYKFTPAGTPESGEGAPN